MQGAESIYREFLEVKHWSRDGPGVTSMVTTLVSELLYNQEEGLNKNTNTADLLLTLSLRAHTKDMRVREEISRAVYILSGGGSGQIHDLLITWLQEATHRFIWLWPTLKRAKIIPLLMAWVESTCHRRQDKTSDLTQAADAMQTLRRLSQEYSYGNDILSTQPHNLLAMSNNARLLQMVRPDRGNQIRRLSQDIQFSAIECIKFITTPKVEDDPLLHNGGQLSSRPGWNIETTWNWLLQTMLALKLLPDEDTPGRQGDRYTTGLHTLHQLTRIESNLMTQQKEEAWLLLGRDEIPDLYAHLICAQLYDTDRSASIVMAAVLEGYTQAISRISRDVTANEEPYT